MAETTITRRQGPNPSARILVADALHECGVVALQNAGLSVDVRTGLSEDELVEAIEAYDGLVVRSATTVTPSIIQAGKRLQVIGRAGVGVDNIDLKAATMAGIIVQNTPLGNITSAAEHAIALLFSLARNIPRADQQMKAGKWSKKGLTGVELSQKTLGIVGLGKVGAIVAKVAKALEMKILAHDPYLTEKRAADLGVKKVELDELLEQADFITLHSPLTPETKGLIDSSKFAKMKKSARLVNCARGGILVESDLAKALDEQQIAGAGLDVFEQEPLPEDSYLRKVEHLTLTPHLGASTEEAQERVAEDIAKQFVDFFINGLIRNAVNINVALDPKLAPFARLAEQMGAMAAQLVKSPVRALEVGAFGQLALGETKELALCALQGLLARSSSDPVTLVNAPVLAEARGIELIENKSDKSVDYSNLLKITLRTSDSEHVLTGTCFDGKVGRVVQIDDFDVEIQPSEHLLIMLYPDQPGMVGKFGSILGDAGINIANMAVGRREKRGKAVVVLTLDDPLSEAVLKSIKSAVSDADVYPVEL